MDYKNLIYHANIYEQDRYQAVLLHAITCPRCKLGTVMRVNINLACEEGQRLAKIAETAMYDLQKLWEAYDNHRDATVTPISQGGVTLYQ